MQCGEYNCVANLDGECCTEKCEGALIQIPTCPTRDRELRARYYELLRKMFDEDFAKNSNSKV